MIYAVTYSTATWDPYYRSQTSTRVEADSPKDAIEKIRRGTAGTGYRAQPSAKIVRIKPSARQ